MHFLFLLLLMLWAAPARADCTGPAGVESQTAYDFTEHRLELCTGSNWLEIAPALPAGANGQVQFRNGTAFGADTGLFWNNTDKRLGIGTATPFSTLQLPDVYYGGTLSPFAPGPLPGFSIVNDTDFVGLVLTDRDGVANGDDKDGTLYWGDATSDNLRFTFMLWNGTTLIPTERMRITGAGNIGIGTIAPVATLDINGWLRRKKNASAPAACNATYDGSIALTSARRLCICDGAAWTEINAATTCSW